jgi:hypothetical protein
MTYLFKFFLGGTPHYHENLQNPSWNKDIPEQVDLITSEDEQLTETCKGNAYLQIESHWTVSTIIL